MNLLLLTLDVSPGPTATTAKLESPTRPDTNPTRASTNDPPVTVCAVPPGISLIWKAVGVNPDAIT